MRTPLLIVCAVLFLFQAQAQEPQGKVITDRSPVSAPDVGRAWPDNQGGEGPMTGSERPRKRWELVLGVVGFGALLVYGLLRWQAKAQRRNQ